ncbi:hypothetical protein [Desulfosoma caldarium]|uniref:Uncharacterized protein n=1 Tax=Desulfosoma caldarium TaxID=610254 RepID=A0A3N1VJE9_9BACT|nr:hypothetical protein [Desulfosoma caldarium]ROR02934.1 hypothetical protein EDC27_0181 [Desulfosoma caldarium]
MGQCIYCGKPAGFLKKKHKKCEQQHEKGKSEIISLVGKIGAAGGDLHQLERSIERVASMSFIDKNTLKSLLVSGWERAVNIAFDDGLLSEKEESALIELKEHFALPEEILDKNGAYSKLEKGAVLRDIMNGTLPERIKIDVSLPFNFQKTEKVVWVFQGVNYYEEKTRTRYVGGSQGFSIRIAKGLYYRTGAFKGERVQTSETVYADTGLLGITNKHIYFAGSVKRFRIAYNKIVTFEPFSDGIGIQRDAQTVRPQLFETGDGWFTYNLIRNLAQL